MENSQKSKLVNDIENSLDDFFGEKDQTAPATPPHTGSSLEGLKSAVLSIDWEITDQCLSDLIGETDALLPTYRKEPETHALLRMLRALSRYIQQRKAQAHQDAIKRVMSVFASIESLVNDKQMHQTDRKRLVAKEISAFKKLKEQIESHRKATVPIGATSATEAAAEAAGTMGNGAFQAAMAELEARFNARIEEMKGQIESLRKELDRLRKG